MGDKHLGHFAQDAGYGFYTENGRYDIGIVEVSAITEECGLALTTSCGIVAEALHLCDKIIIEVNTGQPSFEGMHDIHMQNKPPRREPFLITKANSRIGTPYVPCDPEKIVAIVESKNRDKGRAFAEMDDTSEAIAGHIMEFFAHEVKKGPPARAPAATAVRGRFHRQRRCRRAGKRSLHQPFGIHRSAAGHHARLL